MGALSAWVKEDVSKKNIVSNIDEELRLGSAFS
jgi:hypothetical protein